jgi:hypothetical protein
MVATRHSIPSTAGDESPPPAPNNRKAINALKKLRIAGKRTLIGDKKEEEEQAVETYHYRGGIYARTAKTPSQWVENQPMRYRKQTSEMRDNEASEAEQEDEDKEGPRIPTRKRARVVSLGSAEEPAPKRTRRSAPEAYNAISLNDHDSVGEDTPRRTRRTLPDVYYGHPKRRPSDSTGNTPRRRRRTRAEEEISIPNSILYDYAVVGGKDQKSCQEAARDRAIYMGWDVAPIENRFSKDSTANRRARAVAKDIVHLIHVNTELDKFYTEYQVASKNLEASKDRQKQGEAEKVADEVDAEILRAGIASEPPGASTAEPHADTPRARTASPRSARQQQDPHEQTPPSNEPKASHQDGSLAETESSVDRHDSAASFSPSSVSKIPSMDHEFADPNLPDKNSTGQKLRWSLPTSVTNEDRAEAGIHRGRLEGESRSARRRRIKREHKMMNGWDVKTDASSQRGREDRGGSSQPGADDNDSLYHRD